MPGCVFSATGQVFDVDAFLVASPWRESAVVFRRGEPTKSRTRPVHESSGFAFGISDSDEDELETQLRESSEFLHEERAELERLASFPGVEGLEFRIGLFWREDTLCQFHSLPPDFMRFAGDLGVSVTLCIYGAHETEAAAQKPDA
jgi:hypothetical protein